MDNKNTKPSHAAGPLELAPHARRKKWANLHEALAGLRAARGLARAEEPEQTGALE